MTQIYVIPRPGARVRHPETGHVIPPEGENVVRSTYWLRRQRDGDVQVSEARDQGSEKPAGIPAPPDDSPAPRGAKRR
jgi:hypothetical protein